MLNRIRLHHFSALRAILPHGIGFATAVALMACNRAESAPPLFELLGAETTGVDFVNELPSVAGLLGAIPLSLPKVDEDRVRVLSLLGVRDVMQPPGDPELDVDGLRPGYSGPDARV